MNRSTVAFSAPGKVLLAGGYLVLDRKYTGLVCGLDARIHVHVQPLQTSPGLTLSEIIVKSPQFEDAEWRYGYRETEDCGGIEVTQLRGVLESCGREIKHVEDKNNICILQPLNSSTSAQSRNGFVETALAYALTYASAVDHSKIGPASITILADTDYYSHPGSSDSEMASRTDRFLKFDVPLHDSHKTGLGSSAALVTALTTAVVAYHAPRVIVDVSTAQEKSRLHNLAQAAHCAAQGKIGSGFDVAAAVYGSCIYRRFSPSILERLGDLGTEGFSTRLRRIVEDTDSIQKWDVNIDKKFTAVVPRSLRLVMCDVDCGSETVGMVRDVLAWRQAKPEQALLLWETLQKGNEELAAELESLALKSASSSEDYDNIREVILTIRSLIREMSSESGVPIEPVVQTKLIDSCCQLPGVLGGIVPGAGGFDAVALLVENKQHVIDGLRRFLENYHIEARDNASVNIRRVRLLRVKQEDQGVRKETLTIYQEWLG